MTKRPAVQAAAIVLDRKVLFINTRAVYHAYRVNDQITSAAVRRENIIH